MGYQEMTRDDWRAYRRLVRTMSSKELRERARRSWDAMTVGIHCSLVNAPSGVSSDQARLYALYVGQLQRRGAKL